MKEFAEYVHESSIGKAAPGARKPLKLAGPLVRVNGALSPSARGAHSPHGRA